MPQLEPRSFSFNSMYGACPECHGLGSRYDFDPAKVITDWSKPLLDGGLGPGSASQGLIHALQVTAAAHGIDLNTPFEKFPDKIQDLLLEWRIGPRQNRIPRNFRIPEAESGRVDFGRLSRVADGSHVGDGVSRMSWQAAAAGKPGGESERHVDCRFHSAADFAARWKWREASSSRDARRRSPAA